MPRSTLPKPEGFLGLLSGFPATFGLPAARLTLPGRWTFALEMSRPPVPGRAAGLCISGRDLAKSPPGRFFRPSRVLLRTSSGFRRPIGQVCRSVPPNVGRAVTNRVCPIGLDPVLDVRPVELGELAPVKVQLRAVDILPVGVLEVELAVEVNVVEALVAVNIDVASIPVTAPDTPIIPIDRSCPYCSGCRRCEESAQSDTNSLDRNPDSS